MNNKLNKIFVVFMVFALAFTLSGCGQQNTTGKTFIGGTEGLKTSFLPGSPPDRTVDGGQGGFSIVVKAENVGESDIKATEGYVQIWGLDARTYGSSLPDFKKKFSEQSGFGEELRGAVKNFDGTVLNGGVATIELGDLKYGPTIQGDIQQKIWANVCYKYTTKVATQICVKNNVEQALSGNEICTVEGEKSPQNSGAPIHVTSLKESYAGNGKIGLTLQISHVGTGDAFFKDDKLECNDVESNLDRGKVRIKFKDVQVSGRNVPVVCQGVSDGYVRLFKDGSGKETTTLYCTVDVSGSDNVVEVPLDLELGYTYLQHVESDITIRHIAK
ncbi:MAG TPA: hypothetical protein VEC16_03115 [Alphaproteobacteria bacterium]|nr:hypothetical protein [Alphaproteobacteria bacterium]